MIVNGLWETISEVMSITHILMELNTGVCDCGQKEDWKETKDWADRALREHLTAAAQHSFGREGVAGSHLGLPAMKTGRAGG